MLYQTRRILVEAIELQEPMMAEDTDEIIGVPGDWIVRKLGGEEWYLVPGPEFAEHYEETEDDVDVEALEKLVGGQPEGQGDA